MVAGHVYDTVEPSMADGANSHHCGNNARYVYAVRDCHERLLHVAKDCDGLVGVKGFALFLQSRCGSALGDRAIRR